MADSKKTNTKGATRTIEKSLTTDKILAVNNANAQRALPTLDALKLRFKEGSIPLQSDFSDLIDIADIGRRAVGGAPDQNDSGDGLKLDGQGRLQLKLNAGSDNSDYAPLSIKNDALATGLGAGLIYKANAICVGQGNGIKVNADNISVDPKTVLPKGIITMFSGSAIPEGWALCDGSNGTPNLIDRFILGGNLTDINKKNSLTLSGVADNKILNVNTGIKSTSISVTVQSHTLTINEMPKHSHNIKSVGGSAMHLDDGDSFPIDGWAKTSDVGGGAGHSHDATASQAAHDHSVNIIQPYYILAFIMKT